MFRRVLILALLVTGCGSAPAPSSSTAIAPGDTVRLELKGGRYRVAWEAAGCSSLTIEWAPLTGSVIPVPVTLPSGEAIVTLPAGRGYLNRAGACTTDYALHFDPAP